MAFMPHFHFHTTLCITQTLGIFGKTRENRSIDEFHLAQVYYQPTARNQRVIKRKVETRYVQKVQLPRCSDSALMCIIPEDAEASLAGCNFADSWVSSIGLYNTKTDYYTDFDLRIAMDG